jgi:hypothetical protein
MDCESARHAQSHSACADRPEKLSSTDPTGLIVVLVIHSCLLFVSKKILLDGEIDHHGSGGLLERIRFEFAE